MITSTSSKTQKNDGLTNGHIFSCHRNKEKDALNEFEGAETSIDNKEFTFSHKPTPFSKYSINDVQQHYSCLYVKTVHLNA